MATQYCRMSRLRPILSPLTATTRPLPDLTLLITRPRPNPIPRIPFSHSSRRFLFQTVPRASNQRPEPRDKPPQIDYDPKLGEPWAPHHLRNAKPLVFNFLKSTRTHTVVIVSLVLALAFYAYNLEVVPVSGRRRFNCFNEHQVQRFTQSTSKVLIDSLLSQGASFLLPHDPRMLMLRRIMARLLPVAGEDAGSNKWEVYIIDHDDPRAAQAFVLPGGKVFVVSGMFQLARTEGQLAAVLSHEIAHNMARHVAERMSQSLSESLLLGPAVVLVAAAAPLAWLGGWFFGGELMDFVLSRPLSRMQESEADYIGLMMMSEACYDPREALAFWSRMSQMQQHTGAEVPEILSTHPSNRHRIENINKWMPEALEKRKLSDCHGTQGFAEMFRRAMDQGTVLRGQM